MIRKGDLRARRPEPAHTAADSMYEDLIFKRRSPEQDRPSRFRERAEEKMVNGTPQALLPIDWVGNDD